MTLDEPLRLASADETEEFYAVLRSRHKRFARNVRIFCNDAFLRGKEVRMHAVQQFNDLIIGTQHEAAVSAHFLQTRSRS